MKRVLKICLYVASSAGLAVVVFASDLLVKIGGKEPVSDARGGLRDGALLGLGAGPVFADFLSIGDSDDNE